MTFSRETVAARVRALLAKTTENGCSEAEAMFAAEKARELMDKYDIEIGEAGMAAEGTEKMTFDETTRGRLDLTSRMTYRIAEFCDVKSWRSPYRGTATFFGLKSDVEFAVWLTRSLEAFVNNAADSYLAGQRFGRGSGRSRYMADKSFTLGCIGRINVRLGKLTAERKAAMKAAAGTGTSLVVVKSAIVEKDFRKLGLRLRSSSRRDPSVASGAYAAGQAAGDRASFGRPLGGGASGALRIGGK